MTYESGAGPICINDPLRTAGILNGQGQPVRLYFEIKLSGLLFYPVTSTFRKCHRPPSDAYWEDQIHVRSSDML
jgi:hypothetical protein